MWKTVTLVLGLVGAVLGAVVKSSDTPLEKNSWALLIAGSNGIENYRHQADICHSYHVMIAEGIPANRIIVMMYDDIAYNKENPTPGVIINKPNGTNVYAGVKIDYKGDDVSPVNFMNVLKGNKSSMKGIGSGRVIESDATSNVFVYFADHGGTGLLAFPNEILGADELERTLREMNEAKRYNKLIMYIEACESGSMFENILAESTNVFVMTAAARDESSYAWYCTVENCLGDEFSIQWMERLDGEDKGSIDQFFHQYQELRPKVTKSHIQIYGDFSLGTDAMTPNNKSPRSSAKSSSGDNVAINSRDVPLYYYKQKLARANDMDSQMKAQQDLDALVEGRKSADQLMEKLVALATIDFPEKISAVSEERMPLSLDMFPCYKDLLHSFRSHCFEHKHAYLLQHYYKLANICILGLDTSKLLREIPSLCAPYKAELKSTVL
uniref:legumain n=1 Tax=Lygus hesperus TaxID=30085 RepID=A0A0A9WU12_LYGHE